jgi:hypothetical protein
MKSKIFLLIMCIFFIFPFVSSAHYLTGYVNDALDGTLADGHRVVVWNPSVGINDNITDTIGVLGNSNTEKMYLVDCELLNTPCEVGDNLSIKVYDAGDGYVSLKDIFVNITGAGFDFLDNLTLNSPIIFNSIVVDDSLNFTLNEIDLLAGNTREVFCEAVVEDLDGPTFSSFYSEFLAKRVLVIYFLTVITTIIQTLVAFLIQVMEMKINLLFLVVIIFGIMQTLKIGNVLLKGETVELIAQEKIQLL